MSRHLAAPLPSPARASCPQCLISAPNNQARPAELDPGPAQGSGFGAYMAAAPAHPEYSGAVTVCCHVRDPDRPHVA